MDPHLLRTFVAVADCGSFSAAAERLGYTQSAVSQHIAALESDLGTPLLHRRPVSPTPAGERLLEHAGAILLRLDAARADVRRTVAEPPSRLDVAASPLAARSLAPHLAAARRTYPGTQLSLTICPRAEVVEAVATTFHTLGLVDGISAPSDPLPLAVTASLHTIPTTEEHLAVAIPRPHPLARPATPAAPGARAAHGGLSVVDLVDLVDARWIDAPDLAAPLATLSAAVGADRFRPAFSYTGTDLHTLLALIEAGHGLAVLPASTITPNLAAVPLNTPRLVHRTELVHAGLSVPVAKTLADLLTARQ
ncbi:LysR family transcriptional regulator [Kribbella sp. NPDC048915]|uniref:LysR family transcriptional regulator n=1 Tax=Kribbella sp. NPDC048915 TaxID=3155148 RepID=UPI0033E2A294